MAAQLQGVLIAAAAAALAACAGAPQAPAGPAKARASEAVALPAGERPRLLPPPVPQAAAGLGPEILLPATAAGDAVLATVGATEIRQSHAYARLLTADPKVALSAVDLLVFDVLVAKHAEQHAIRVPVERVDAMAKAEEEALRKQVADELRGQMDFAGYLWRAFGLQEDDWRAALRLRCAQRLYHGYVLRYLALREDRAQVRFLAHKDEALCRELADKVRQGADFATLAQRHSEDPSRRDGGLLPPFARGFQHPVAKAAFELQRGEVSAPFEAPWGDGRRWFVVYCLDRMPGRDVSFAAVAAEIDAGLLTTPISPLETSAYTLRWRGELEQAGAVDRK